VKTKISEEGEICIKNNCLMKGYYKNPALTLKAFDQDGYLKTGDKGNYDEEGNLIITGRIKDQFKTDKGKYISPSGIELELIKNTNIEQGLCGRFWTPKSDCIGNLIRIRKYQLF
jgi:long-chain acyl-CoA synthetase